MFERLRATAVGSLAGLTAYIAWLTRRYERIGDPESWRLSGPLKWFILAGAVLGLLGGLSFVERWLERERGEVFENIVFNFLFLVAIIAMAAVVIQSLRQ